MGRAGRPVILDLASRGRLPHPPASPVAGKTDWRLRQSQGAVESVMCGVDQAEVEKPCSPLSGELWSPVAQRWRGAFFSVCVFPSEQWD